MTDIWFYLFAFVWNCQKKIYMQKFLTVRNFSKKYFERGSNSRPSACKADVLTTTPSKLI